MGLEVSFVDKNKHLKKQLAANFETHLHRASDCVHHQNLENCHEFLRAYTDIFTKNVYATEDFTYSNLKNIIKNDKLVILSGDKDLCVVIMQRGDKDIKLQNMIDDGIRQGIYSPLVDTNLSDLKKFQDFLCRNFNGKLDRYEDMRPISNQPGKIYATAKTHKFDSLENITIQNLKFHSIISQIETYTYNTAKVLSDYLKLLCQNEYKIKDTQSFASQIKEQLHQMKMKNMSHMMWIPYSLTFLCKKPFTILSIKFTQKRNFPKSAIKQLSRLLIKVTTECLFQLKQKLYKQTEGCSMGGPLSVTLADIHMI